MNTTDPFTDAARAYAEQACYQDENIPIAEAGFRAGWEAARTHLAAQEDDGHDGWCGCGCQDAQETTDANISESVANLIRDLTDPDDCWFDHSGGCQAHGYLSLTPEQECPHSEAKRLLAARATR